MQDYKPNSHRFKEQQKRQEEEQKEKKVSKVIDGNARLRKKSGVSKLADIIIAEDINTVKNSLFSDILVPALKKVISDVVRNGIDMILYGSAGENKPRGPGSKISYSKYYEQPRAQTARPNPTSLGTYNYDEVEIPSRSEAEAVLMQMDEIVDTYGFVKVADLYELAGISGNYTGYNYGWDNIRSASVVRLPNGWYTIKLPKAKPID